MIRAAIPAIATNEPGQVAPGAGRGAGGARGKKGHGAVESAISRASNYSKQKSSITMIK